MSEHRSLLKSTSTVSTLTILSRIFGYFREQRIASLLGTGDIADAYLAAFRIPNLLRRLVGEGAVSAAFIPTFSRYLVEGKKEEAFEFVNALLTALTFFLTVITILGVIFSPQLVLLFATGYSNSPGKLDTTAMLNRIMFPYLAFVSLSALVMGVLNSLHRFAAPAFAPVMLNLSVIGFSFFSGAFREPAVALAVGVVVGGILQIVIQIPSLRATGWRLRWVWNLRHPGVLRVSKLMGPLLFGIGIVQINVLIDLQFATYMGEGAFASINYADRIMELVLGGYAIALSTAVLPLLSRQAAEERLGEMRTTLNFSIRLILFVTLPATAGLILLGTPIVEILFERGEFTAESTALTVNALIYFALGLSLFSLMKIIVPAYYALHDTRTPVMIAFLAMLLNLALNFVFFFVFFDWLRNGGPPLATSISALFSCIVLFVIFRNRHGALGLRSIAVSIGKFLIATVVMGVVAYAVIHIPEFYAGSFWQRATALVVSIAAATGTYFATAYLLRARELTEMGGIFSRRAARTP